MEDEEDGNSILGEGDSWFWLFVLLLLVVVDPKENEVDLKIGLFQKPEFDLSPSSGCLFDMFSNENFSKKQPAFWNNPFS